MKLLTTLIFISCFGFISFSQQIIFTSEDSLGFEFRSLPKPPYSGITYEKSVNNACASAISLTPNAALTCGNTVGDNTQAGEVAPPCTGFGGGGVTDRTTWFRFTANNTQMVLDYMRTVATNCATSLAVYGPFASGAGCLPTTAQSVYCENAIAAGDPGDHNLLTGLVSGQDYLVQILNKDCGGPNSGTASFCIGISNVSTNNAPGSATNINACGTAFNGSNSQGYYPSGSGTSLSNLDNNAGTTCATCTAGNDVPFVVNNDSWFNFCSANAGQWQVTFNVGTCFQAAPNNGLQFSILTGSSSNLTNLQNGPNPAAPGSSFTSGVITLTAGQCVYLVVDGFAGDQCTYSYTLTNLTGGCVLLPVELTSFNVQRFERQSYLKWNVESERNNEYFTIQRSTDGWLWETVHTENSVGDHTHPVFYNYIDDLSTVDNEKTVYYKLSQTDKDGSEEVLAISVVKGVEESTGTRLNIVPNPITDNDLMSISIESKYDTFASVSLVDLQGNLITTKNVSINRGLNVIPFESSILTDGIYFFQYNSIEENQSVKFIKQ